MGVTIHFAGSLRDEAAYDELLRVVTAFGSRHGWPCDLLPPEVRTLARVRNEEDWDHTGVTRGIIVQPHTRAEALRFEFDEILYIQEYCKTQFAGAESHIRIVTLLRDVAPFFDVLSVDDEGEFWETGQLDRLVKHFDNVSGQIARLLEERSSRRSAVRLPSGRIVDVMD